MKNNKSPKRAQLSRRSALAALVAGGAAPAIALNGGGAGDGAVAAVKEARSFADFGAKADGAMPTALLRSTIERAWQSALANGHDLYHPGGTYDIGDAPFPWRKTGGSAGLLDCRNVTIFGNGPGSIFQTSSAAGADVFQLHAVRNLHFRNLCLKATISADDSSGSNGISVTGGYDNITLLDIWCEMLPTVAKSDHLDGGKALTVQCGRDATEMGVLKARIFAKGCGYGFGFDGDLARFARMKVVIDVDLVAEDCYGAVVIGAAPAAAAVAAGVHSGISIRAQSINCQKDVWLARVHGVKVDCIVISSKPATARRNDPAGRPWLPSDDRVEALVCNYVKNGRIEISGNKGDCDHKLRIESAAAGASGLDGSSSDCEIAVDLGGIAASGDVAVAELHGPALRTSVLMLTSATGTVPQILQVAAADNLIIQGSGATARDLCLHGALMFADDTGTTAGQIAVERGVIALRSGGGGAGIASFCGKDGRMVARIRPDGSLASDAVMRASDHGGNIVAVKPEYDLQDNIIGYVPIYRGYID